MIHHGLVNCTWLLRLPNSEAFLSPSGALLRGCTEVGQSSNAIQTGARDGAAHRFELLPEDHAGVHFTPNRPPGVGSEFGG